MNNSIAVGESPAVIDVEASGFGRGSYPIEVGTVLRDGTSHCFLVRPEPDWMHWDPAAEEVHGISRAVLTEIGLPVAEVAERLNELLGTQRVYSDGWGVDRTWLALLFDRAGIPQRFTLDSVRSLLNEDEAAHWHPTHAQVQAELNLERHRASSDALMVRNTLTRICHARA